MKEVDFKDLIVNDSLLLSLSKIVTEKNLEAYIVGGFVRDQLLGRNNRKDIDVVVVGSGIDLAQHFQKLLGDNAKLAVYKNFGTAAIHFNEREFEFVGARKESYRSDSRKPIVENGTLQDDQNRRDFTINALAVSLHTKSLGDLVDPFNGIADLKAKIIRTPLKPDITFSDDPLRMLRAIRFAGQLTFDIEPDTWEGLINMKERLSIISQERISEELNKLIMADQPSYGFKLLYYSGILVDIFPEMQKLHGVHVVNGKSHKDNFYHTLEVLDNTAATSNDLWLRWAAILHDIAKPATQRFDQKVGWTFHGHEDLGAKWVPKIFKRMKLPLNEHMRKVQNLVKLHLRPIALVNDRVTDSAIRRLLFDAGDDFDDLMILCRADITSKNKEKVKKYLSNFNAVEQKIRKVEEIDQMRNFKLSVTGEDIMARYSLPPSRIVGEIKEEIKEAVMEGIITNNREEALDLLDKIALKRNLKQN